MNIRRRANNNELQEMLMSNSISFASNNYLIMDVAAMEDEVATEVLAVVEVEVAAKPYYGDMYDGIHARDEPDDIYDMDDALHADVADVADVADEAGVEL